MLFHGIEKTWSITKNEIFFFLSIPTAKQEYLGWYWCEKMKEKKEGGGGGGGGKPTKIKKGSKKVYLRKRGK